MTTQFINNFNDLILKRYPDTKNNPLRAWDAADELLLHELYVNYSIKNSDKLLIFNDSFGALSLALNEYQPTMMTDSYISEKSLIANEKSNNSIDKNISIINSLSNHSHPYNYILIKATKSIDYLKYFLINIRPFINNDTVVIVAGMVKYMPKTLWAMLEKTLGNTSTSLAKKKAKLIKVKVESNITSSHYPITFKQEDSKNIIYNHASVFSKNSLDIGTRFLLQNLPKFDHIENIIDLGCGNGVIGLNLAMIYPQAKITFTDESYMAVDSARLTIKNNIDLNKRFIFKVDDCLDSSEKNHVDLIVCNPPFHQSQNIGIKTALQMFYQSHITLKKGGHLIIIANRHLPYYSHLKNIFKHVKTIASNHKFNIFHLIKR